MFNAQLSANGAIKSVDRGFADFWYTAIERVNSGLPSGVTPKSVYETVGILYRAIELIAQKLSDFPFEIMIDGEVVTDKPEYASIMRGWKRRAAQTVITRYLKPGAYWYLSTNAQGRNVIPVLLNTNDVMPYDDQTEIKAFRYTGRLKDPNTNHPIPRDIPPARMIWFWEYDVDNQFFPGPARLYPALANAGVVWAMDRLLAAYFNRGGVPVTLFPIPPGTDPNVEKQFQSFLDRIASGLRNAFKYLAVRFDVKPIVLGHLLKDMQADSLYKLHSYRILEDLGIPPSILNSESAHDSTASADMAKLYLDLIIPLFELMAEQVNTKVFEAGNSKARIVAQTNRIEALQDMHLAQAKAVSEATGGNPMTLEEGRTILELPPLPGVDVESPPPNGAQLTSMLEIVKAVGIGDISPEQGAAMLQAGFPQLTNAQISALTTPPEKQQPEAPATTTPPTTPQQQTEQVQEPQMDNAQAGAEDVMKALADWRGVMMTKQDGAMISHDVPDGVKQRIPPALRHALTNELGQCRTRSQVRAVFDKHWPKTHKSMPPPQVLALLERAVNLAEAQKQ